MDVDTLISSLRSFDLVEEDQILDFLEEKEYKVLINSEIDQGKYAFCGHGHGYLLTKKVVEVKQHVKLNMVMNKKLRQDISVIEVHDETGFLVNYSLGIGKTLCYNTEFLLFYVNALEKDQTLKIKFGNLPPSSSSLFFLGRKKLETVYETEIVLKLDVKSDDTCSICPEKVELDTAHITSCMHKFHTRCMEEYIDETGVKHRPECYHLCKEKHGDIIQKYICPLCRTEIKN